MNEYTFRGSNSAFVIFASLISGGQLLKERICSYEQILFLSVDPRNGRVLPSREANRKSQKLFPFVKIGSKPQRCTHKPGRNLFQDSVLTYYWDSGTGANIVHPN